MNISTLHSRKPALAVALGALVLFGAAVSMPAKAGADIGVSIGISQPGVYGRVDIGRFPQPQVVVQQPVYVYRPAPVLQPVMRPVVQPVYMWVPPGHRKHWGKHCAKYGACGAPVYFVQDRWYHEHVAPQPYARYEGRDRDHGRGHGRGHGHDRD
jgi:hypothetical protein